jgi:hypothetical protein
MFFYIYKKAITIKDIFLILYTEENILDSYELTRIDM